MENSIVLKPRTLSQWCWLKVRRAIWKALLHVNTFTRWEFEHVKTEFPRVLSVEETLDRILRGASISRFGDGELNVILGRKLTFQQSSEALAIRLAEVLVSPMDEKMLIAIPPLDLAPETIEERKKKNPFGFWIRFWTRSWRFLKKYLDQSVYANAVVSRIDVFEEVPLDKIKAIWENRDVVFVVPPNGRFRFDDRLFGNVKSATYIDVPPRDAFDRYEELLAEALKYDKDRLFYIAAGPAATVLAYDLYRNGRQALDLGHLTNCYLEYLGEADRPECYPVQSDLPE